MQDQVEHVVTKEKQSVSQAQKNLLSIDVLLKMGASSMTAEEVNALKQQKKQQHQDLLSIEHDDKNNEEVLARRKRFEGDDKLREVLSTFWMVISNHCRRCDLLSRSEYVEFKLMLQFAVLGYEGVDQAEATAAARQAYKHDAAHYNDRIDEVAFKDMLSESIELYADLISKRYYAAFAWSLLNAIVALETNPPKFRTPRLMTGLLVEGGADMEAVIVSKYFADKRERARLAHYKDWLVQNNIAPEVQTRLKDRRGGRLYTHDGEAQDMFDTLAAYRRIAQLDFDERRTRHPAFRLARNQMNLFDTPDEDDDSSSDDGLLKRSSSLSGASNAVLAGRAFASTPLRAPAQLATKAPTVSGSLLSSAVEKARLARELSGSSEAFFAPETDRSWGPPRSKRISQDDTPRSKRLSQEGTPRSKRISYEAPPRTKRYSQETPRAFLGGGTPSPCPSVGSGDSHCLSSRANMFLTESAPTLISPADLKARRAVRGEAGGAAALEDKAVEMWTISRQNSLRSLPSRSDSFDDYGGPAEGVGGGGRRKSLRAAASPMRPPRQRQQQQQQACLGDEEVALSLSPRIRPSQVVCTPDSSLFQHQHQSRPGSAADPSLGRYFKTFGGKSIDEHEHDEDEDEDEEELRGEDDRYRDHSRMALGGPGGAPGDLSGDSRPRDQLLAKSLELPGFRQQQQQQQQRPDSRDAAFYATVDTGRGGGGKTDLSQWNKHAAAPQRMHGRGGAEAEVVTPKQAMERRGLAKLQECRQKLVETPVPTSSNPHPEAGPNLFSPVKRGKRPALAGSGDDRRPGGRLHLPLEAVHAMAEEERRVARSRAEIYRNQDQDQEEEEEGLEQRLWTKSLTKEHHEKLRKHHADPEQSVLPPAEPPTRQEREAREQALAEKLALAARKRRDLVADKRGYARKAGLPLSNAPFLEAMDEFVFVPRRTPASLGQRIRAAGSSTVLVPVTADDVFLMRLVANLDAHIENKMAVASAGTGGAVAGAGAGANSLSDLCKQLLDPAQGCRRDLIETAAMEFGVDVRSAPKQVLSSRQILDVIYKKRFVLLSSLAQDVDQARRGYLRRQGLSLADASHLPEFIYVPKKAANSLGQRLKTTGFARVTEEDRYVMGLVERVDQHIALEEAGLADMTAAELFEELAGSSWGYTREHLAAACREFDVDPSQMSNAQEVIEAVYCRRQWALRAIAERLREERLGYLHDELERGDHEEGDEDEEGGAGTARRMSYEPKKVKSDEASRNSMYVRHVVKHLDSHIEDHEQQQGGVAASSSSVQEVVRLLLRKESGYTRDALEDAAAEFDLEREKTRRMTPAEVLRTLLLRRRAFRSAVLEDERQARRGYVRRSATAISGAEQLPEFMYLPRVHQDCLHARLQTGDTDMTADDLYLVRLVHTLDGYIDSRGRHVDATPLSAVFQKLLSEEAGHTPARLLLTAAEFRIEDPPTNDPSALLSLVYERRLATLTAHKIAERHMKRGYTKAPSTLPGALKSAGRPPGGAASEGSKKETTASGFMYTPRQQLHSAETSGGDSAARSKSRGEDRARQGADVVYAASAVAAIDQHIGQKLAGLAVAPLPELCRDLVERAGGPKEASRRLAALCHQCSIDTSAADATALAKCVYVHRLRVLSACQKDSDWEQRGYSRTSNLALTNPEGLQDFVFVSRCGTASLGERLKLGSAEVSHDDRFVMTLVRGMDDFLDLHGGPGDSDALARLLSDLTDARAGFTVRGLKQAAREVGVAVNARLFDATVVARDIFFKREHILRSLADEADALRRGERRTDSLSVTRAEGLPPFVFVPTVGEESLGQRLAHGSTKITDDDRYSITLVKALDSHIRLSSSGSAVAPLRELCQQFTSSAAGYTRDRLAAVCREFRVSFTSQSDPHEAIASLHQHRQRVLAAADLEKERQQRGYHRTSGLALLNPDDLPAFVFVATRDPLSLGERLRLGSAEVTDDDRFLMTLMQALDDLVDRREGSGSGSGSDIPLEQALEKFCAHHLSEQAGCSKHRLRLAAAECRVSSQALGSMSGPQVVAAMYEQRLTEYRQWAAQRKAGAASSSPLLLQNLASTAGAHTDKPGTGTSRLAQLETSIYNKDEDEDEDEEEDEDAGDLFLLTSSPDHHSFPVQVFVSPIKTKHPRGVKEPVRMLDDDDDDDEEREAGQDEDVEMSIGRGLLLPAVAACSMDSFDLLRLTQQQQKQERKNQHKQPKQQQQLLSRGGDRLALRPSSSSTARLIGIRGGATSRASLRTIRASASQHRGLLHYSEEMDPQREERLGADPAIYYFDKASRATAKLKQDRVQTSGVVVRPEQLSSEHQPSAEHALLLPSDAPHVPWIPRGGLKLMVSDKTDLVLGWQERRDIGLLAEEARDRCVLRRQGVVKASFESFARRSRRQQQLQREALERQELEHGTFSGAGGAGGAGADGTDGGAGDGGAGGGGSASSRVQSSRLAARPAARSTR